MVLLTSSMTREQQLGQMWMSITLSEQNQIMLKNKPWDAQFAYLLVQPLRNSWITPNHLTTVRLLTGLAAATCLAVGNSLYSNLGAGLFFLSNFLDHTDGELARLSGKTSQWGHTYDLISDALIHVLVFVGIGYGLRNSELGIWAIAMGILVGLSIAYIFQVRNNLEEQFGKEITRQPRLTGFEIEDILYLFPVVTLVNGLVPFLIAAAIGSPLFSLWVSLPINSQASD
jgi:phosphatidylglycerophosphate synthase